MKTLSKLSLVAAFGAVSFSAMAAFSTGMGLAQLDNEVGKRLAQGSPLGLIASDAKQANLSGALLTSSLISHGQDACNSVGALVGAGFDANSVVNAAIASGAKPATMVGCAVAAGADPTSLLAATAAGGDAGGTAAGGFGGGTTSGFGATPTSTFGGGGGTRTTASRS